MPAPSPQPSPPNARLVALAVVHDADGRLLLVRSARRNERWELPGGALEIGESPLHAIRRELVEETGTEVEDLRLVGLYHGSEDGVLRVVFTGGPSTQVHDFAPNRHEILDVGWFPPDSMPGPMPVLAIRMIADAASGVAVYAAVPGDRELVEPDQ